MKHISIQKNRFIIPLASTVGVILLLAVSIAILMTDSDNKKIPADYTIMALILLTYWGSFIVVPLLLIRFIYNISLLFYAGRNSGINIFCAKNLFNPLNFLLFPSLLNAQGLAYRRRCLVTLILLAALVGLVYFLLTLTPIQAEA